MELKYMDDLSKQLGGFNYDNCIRNKALTESGASALAASSLSFKKTGTTICGAIFNEGVVLAADTRATGGSTVGDKNCDKIHYLAPNIYCCGAGTAADCDHVTESMKRELELHRLNTHSESRVKYATARLSWNAFRYGGHLGTHFIIGGVDCKGPTLIEVDNSGCQVPMPYITMGSGCLAAMGILETQYRDNMTEEEAKNMVIAAIEAGIYHDLGSGSNVDVCIIKKGQVTKLRNIRSDNKKVFSKPGGYTFPKERVQVLEEYKKNLVVVPGHVPMDLS